MDRDELLALIGALKSLQKDWIDGGEDPADTEMERYMRAPRGVTLLEVAVQRTVAGEDEDTIRAEMVTWLAEMRERDHHAKAQTLIHTQILIDLLIEELKKLPPYAAH
jgi:hypothetical protein